MSSSSGPFFDRIAERAARELESSGVVRRWPDGSVLFHAGDSSDRVLVVRQGRVKLVATEQNGTETLLAVRGPGSLLGELSAIDGLPRSATATAVGPVACLAIPTERFRAVLADEPSVAMALLEVVTHRLREAEGRRAEYGALGTVERLARRLLELAGESAVVDGWNQDDLAALIGASREAVAKALQSLRTSGVVRTGRRVIEIVDADALRAAARPR